MQVSLVITRLRWGLQWYSCLCVLHVSVSNASKLNGFPSWNSDSSGWSFTDALPGMNKFLLTSPQEMAHINTVRRVIARRHLLLINNYFDQFKVCFNVWEAFGSGKGWPGMVFLACRLFCSTSILQCIGFSWLANIHPSAVSNPQTRTNHDHIFKDKSKFSLSSMSIGQKVSQISPKTNPL